MKKAKSVTTKLNLNYPTVTSGSKHARELRSRCNSLTPEERKRCFKKGMEIINQGIKKK